MIRTSWNFLVAVACLAAAPTAASASPPDSPHGPKSLSYQNPLPVPLADPYVLKEGDTFYLYGTSQPKRGFQVYTSRDLVNWNKEGFCYEKEPGSWATRDFWAPEVVRKDDTFYLFFTAKNAEADIRNICVATASSPLGPFRDVKAPLLPEGSFIDPHAYRDPATGQWYLYATREREPNEILGARLDSSLLNLETSLTRCLVPDQKWERGWTEAPFVIERNGWYYMTYSGCVFWEPEYAIGYAVARHPLGPWTKPLPGPLLRQNESVSGPGHNCILELPDGETRYIIYHRHKEPGLQARYTALDQLVFEPVEDGPDRLACPGAPSSIPRELALPPDGSGLKSGD